MANYDECNEYTKNKIDDIKDLMDKFKYIILRGGTGVGKTMYARIIAEKIVKGNCTGKKPGDNQQICFVPFQRETTYENLFYGVSLGTEGGKLMYNSTEKVIASFLKRANGDKNNKYVLILDDITRTDFSRAMGDFFTALEGGENVVRLGEDECRISENLYVIATMNPLVNAGSIDYAWFRRFYVYDIYSDRKYIIDMRVDKLWKLNKDEDFKNSEFVYDRLFELLKRDIEEGKAGTKKEKIEEAFKKNKERIVKDLEHYLYCHVKVMHDRHFIADSPEQKNAYMPGHGMFMTYDKDKDLKGNIIRLNNKIRYNVVPLLNGYMSEGLYHEDARLDIEVLCHLWDESEEKEIGIDEVIVDKEVKPTFFKRYMANKLREVTNKWEFYLFVLHNNRLMVECKDGAEVTKCFSFEEKNDYWAIDSTDNDSIHVKKDDELVGIEVLERKIKFRPPLFFRDRKEIGKKIGLALDGIKKLNNNYPMMTVIFYVIKQLIIYAYVFDNSYPEKLVGIFKELLEKKIRLIDNPNIREFIKEDCQIIIKEVGFFSEE